jgi:chromosome segregation ATPase
MPQAQAQLNTLTTENADMSAQLSSSAADVARLTLSNDTWEQMYSALAALGCMPFIMTWLCRCKASAGEMKRLRRQLEVKSEEVNASLKLQAQAQEAHSTSLGEVQTQRDLLVADVARLTSAAAERDRVLAALTEEKFQLQSAVQRASEQRAEAEGRLAVMGEELQRAKAEAESLGALVMAKEASIGSLTNERQILLGQIEAERTATQNELAGANAQLARAWTDFAMLAVTCLE